MTVIRTILNNLSNTGLGSQKSNLSWLLSEQILRLLSGIFVGAWVARYLGPTSFGVISYAQAIFVLFQGFTKLGMDETAISELVLEKGNRKSLLGTIFWIKTIAGLATYILLFFLIYFSSQPQDTKFSLFIISSALILQGFESLDFYFQSETRMKAVATCRIIQLAISSMVKIYLVMVGADFESFVIMSLIDHVLIGLFIMITFIFSDNKPQLMVFDHSLMKKLLCLSWPMLLSGICVSIYSRIDLLMVEYYLGETQLGLFAAGTRISEFWNVIPMTISAALFPLIISSRQKSETHYQNTLINIYGLLFWTSLIFSGVVWLFREPLISVLFGNEFRTSSDVLGIHVWTAPFIALGVVSAKWFIIEGLQFHAFMRTFAGMVTSISLNLYLTPRLGITGAAFSSLAGCFVAGFIFDVFTLKTKPGFVLKLKSIFKFHVKGE